MPDLLFLAGLLLAVMATMRLARLRTARLATVPPRSVDRKRMLSESRPSLDTATDDETDLFAAAPNHLDARTTEVLERLENRIRTLEELLRAADRRIVELNALLRHDDPPRQAFSVPPPFGGRHSAPTPAHHQAEALARARDLTQSVQRSGASAAGAIAARYQDVYRLLDQGESAASVAGKLGYNIGEVELIAGLRG